MIGSEEDEASSVEKSDAELAKMNETYDIFISYRRDGGYYQAKTLGESLHNLYPDLRVFLDLEELGSGRFDESLLQHIRNAGAVVLVVSPGALDRCKNDGDWIRREIECALEANRLLIPVFFDNALMPPRESLPEGMQALVDYNGVDYEPEYHASVIEKIVKFLGDRTSKPRVIAAFESTTEREAKARDCLEMATEQARAGNYEKAAALAEQAYALRPEYASAVLAALSGALSNEEAGNLSLVRQHLRQVEQFPESERQSWLMELIDGIERAIAEAQPFDRQRFEVGIATLLQTSGAQAYRFRILLTLPWARSAEHRTLQWAWIAAAVVPGPVVLWLLEPQSRDRIGELLVLAGLTVFSLLVLHSVSRLCSGLAPVLRWLVDPILRDRFSQWYEAQLSRVATTIFSAPSLERGHVQSRLVRKHAMQVAFAAFGTIAMYHMTDTAVLGKWGLAAFAIEWVVVSAMLSAVGVIIVKYFLLMMEFARWPLKNVVSEFDSAQLSRLMNAFLVVCIMIMVLYAGCVLYGYMAFLGQSPTLQAAYLSALSAVGLTFILGFPFAISRALTKSKAEALLKLSGSVEQASLRYMVEGTPTAFEHLESAIRSQRRFGQLLASRPSLAHLAVVAGLTLVVAVIAVLYFVAKFE